MDANWRIELLGRLRATQRDRMVTRLRAHKTGALLAYLAYYLDRPHSREALIELLWPEAEPHSGRNNLSRELSSLRRQLEPPGVPAGAVILADRGSVQLNPAVCTTDVIALERALRSASQCRSPAERATQLTQAVELYQGELLPAYFEPWVLHERERLAALFLHALAQLMRYHQESGDHDAAISWARRAVAADPLWEEGHQDLIRLLAAAGQAEAARRQYQELERLLARELGLEPAPEIGAFIRDLEQRGRETSGQGVKRTLDSDLSIPPPFGPRCLVGPASPPTGTVTFLLAEIDDGAAPEGCLGVLCPLIPDHSGYELQAAGGMLIGAFGRASDALAAAVAMQRHSGSQFPHPSSLPRMALHTGEVAPEKQARQSPPLRYATRLLLAAAPGQILVSERSAVLLQDDLEPGGSLLDLGLYRLRDPAPPEHLFQVCSPDLPAHEFPPPNALPAHEGSLPLPLTRFFGREEEIARLVELLKGLTASSSPPRLITLTGPGGSGKTRLALEVAGQLRTGFHGAVWFVPLQDLTDARLIPDKLLDVLRLPRSPQVQPLEQATAFLARQPSLLLLDNFEHLATDGAPLVQMLLERVPGLNCLVTSRQRLNLPGEQEFPVAPLPVPEGVTGSLSSWAPGPRVLDTDRSPCDSRPPTPDILLKCASVRLFVDRAQAVRPDFQVTRTNAGAVAELCARLEGLPLALELAAARVGVLAPQQMLERLSHRFELLARAQRVVVPRHRSLWAALEWSYQLLPAELQRFFARLSVFQGGWTLEAAAAVAGVESGALGGTLTLQCLEQLRECSLVQAAEVGGEMRFRLLETLREYGAELLGPEERVAVAHRHASYFLALAERAEPELVRADQAAWLDRLEREQHNLRAALAWLETSGETQAALRLGGALREFWYVRGDLVEGLERLKGLLALPGAEVRTSARAKALNSAGVLACILNSELEVRALMRCVDAGEEPHASLSGEYGASRRVHEESLTIGRELGDRWNIAFSLTGLGMTLPASLAPEHGGNLEAARLLLEEALPIWRELDAPWGIAYALTGLGWVARSQRDAEGARALCQECLQIRSEQGDWWGVALSLQQLGSLAREQGEYEEARARTHQCLALARELGDRRHICLSLNELGQVAYLQGDLSTARDFLEQGLPLAREIGHKGLMRANLAGLVEVAGDQRDLETASAYLEEAMSIWQNPGDSWCIAWSRCQHGRIAQQRGNRVAARRCFVESLASAQAAGSKREIANCLEGLAAVAEGEGHPDRACRLFGASAALLEADGRPLAPVDHLRCEQRRAAVRAALGEEAFARAWEAGRMMTPEQAVEYALE
jgi:predicted ATPase/DNA-binding SARP family transcriptional activator